MSLVKPEARDVVSEVLSIALLENAKRRSRERWQETQLLNLVAFVRERSSFWAQRIGAGHRKIVDLRRIPILRREDVRRQVEAEGALFRSADLIPVHLGYTSGSSGSPLAFYRSAMNKRYESAQGLYQALQGGVDFKRNRTQMRTTSKTFPFGFSVESRDSWMGPLSQFARSGKNRTISYNRPDMAHLRREFLKAEIGYFVANPWFVETLLQSVEPSFLNKAGMYHWTPIGGAPSDSIRKVFNDLSIPIRAHYSSREIGLMATECNAIPGYYHVANSNVLVEVDVTRQLQMGKASVAPILITHLHSYATPFIRYENGDVATYHRSCPCGHDGPTLSNLYGRQKNLVKKDDGSVSTFFIQVKDNRWLTKFDEFRIRQTATNLMEIDVAGNEPLTAEDVENFRAMVRSLAGPEFDVKVCAHEKIDWGADIKRLGYRSEIL